MKNIFSTLLIIILFQSCKESPNTNNTAIDFIKKVETGLATTPVYIEGDSTANHRRAYGALWNSWSKYSCNI